MQQLILVIHILIAFLLIALILMQQGKGATTGAAFGVGASQSVFGSRGATSFLFKLTAILGIMFFLTSVGLTYLGTKVQKQTSLAAEMDGVKVPVPVSKENTAAPTSAPVIPLPNEKR